MEQKSEILHQFLSDVFGDILKREEDSLAAGDLSLREVQLIDAVCRTVDQGGDNRSTAIAAARRVAAGTLTCAVDLLVKKGLSGPAAGRQGPAGGAADAHPAGPGRQ